MRVNILFANYGDFSSNSMNHIAPFANRLTELGHSCIVAVPANPRSVDQLETAYFQPATFQSVLDTPNHFPNSKGADIVHAWTPREGVRTFVEQYARQFKTKVIVHLEDNEEHLFGSYYRRDKRQLEIEGLPPDFKRWEPGLSRPLFWQGFMAMADAATMVIDSLNAYASDDRESMELLPSVDLSSFTPAPQKRGISERVQVADDEKVIVYPGGITSSNREDVRSLYLAVKLLNDRGVKTRLFKTGPSDPSFHASFGFDPADFVTDLGIIPREQLPELLSFADVCIQPGKPDAFNQYRLPSKLPEFLACGKATITTATNIGLRLSENEECLLLHEGSPEEIADKCIQIFDSPTLAVTLAEGARSFAERNFDLTQNTRSLIEFYEVIRRSGEGNWNPLHDGQKDLREVLRLRIKEMEAKAASATLVEGAKKLVETTLAKTSEREEANEASDQPPEQKSDGRLEQLATEAQILRDKVHRMSNSVSWKLTSPLRALRRLLIDPFTRKPKASHRDTGIEKAVDEPTPSSSPAESPTPESEESPPKAQATAEPPPAYRDYGDFCERMEPLVEEYTSNFENRIDDLKVAPLISIILPVYNTPEKWLSEAINSVINQIYPNWELCIADDASTEPKVGELLERYRKIDDRIRVEYRDTNGHISATSNSALQVASGTYIALLDHDDVLAPHALARIVDAIEANPKAKIIYSDEDKIDEEGNRSSPHFKSDWNPDLLMGQNFISHLGVYSKSEVDAVGGFRLGYEGAQDWDLALRISERCKDDQIVHIPEVLYHWRTISGSTALDIGEKNYAHEAAGKAIKDALRRRGSTARIQPVDRFYWRVVYPTPTPEPAVSLIIPTRDRVDLLKSCIASIEEKTSYGNYTFTIVDNDSKEQATLDYLAELRDKGHTIIHSPGEFNFNRLNNIAIKAGAAPLVCLLNNDITVIDPEWLGEMVSQATRLPVGVVGAKLLYPHNHVQHAGVVLGIGGVASEAFKRLHLDDDGYIHRAHLVGNYSAVTGACMMFRRSIWEEVEGFNEQDVPNAFGDIDFCLRVREGGYRVLFTPFALLHHHESASRGNDLEPDKVEAFKKAVQYMQDRWISHLDRDPYYNPNLTLSREDFTLAFPPRGYSTA